ncbi:MAG: hypothetical protein OEZ58_01575 [Gammaproteobacteria bacterium]|nr:hypothetical protein [Gammaproteobacteria bacterium]MDH5727651.1 hypothetical protein [Gammaproteobacteria bacterium]
MLIVYRISIVFFFLLLVACGEEEIAFEIFDIRCSDTTSIHLNRTMKSHYGASNGSVNTSTTDEFSICQLSDCKLVSELTNRAHVESTPSYLSLLEDPSNFTVFSDIWQKHPNNDIDSLYWYVYLDPTEWTHSDYTRVASCLTNHYGTITQKLEYYRNNVLEGDGEKTRKPVIAALVYGNRQNKKALFTCVPSSYQLSFSPDGARRFSIILQTPDLTFPNSYRLSDIGIPETTLNDIIVVQPNIEFQQEFGIYLPSDWFVFYQLCTDASGMNITDYFNVMVYDRNDSQFGSIFKY